MKVPKIFVPDKKVSKKLKDSLLERPKSKFPFYPDETVYQTVVYSQLYPEDLETMKISDDKLFRVMFEINHKDGVYQICLEPHLSIRECDMLVNFIELDGNKEGLKYLIDKFIKYNKANGADVPSWDEVMIQQSVPIGGPSAWYSNLNVGFCYLPRGIATFAKKFIGRKYRPIDSVSFKNISEGELKKSGFPEENIILKKLEGKIILREGEKLKLYDYENPTF